MKKILMFAAAIAVCSAAGAQEFNAGISGMKTIGVPSVSGAKAAQAGLPVLSCGQHGCGSAKPFQTQEAAQRALDSWAAALAGYGIQIAELKSYKAVFGGGYDFSFAMTGTDRLDSFIPLDSAQAVQNLQKAGVIVLAAGKGQNPMGSYYDCVTYIVPAGKPVVQSYLYRDSANRADVLAKLNKAEVLIVADNENGLQYLGFQDTIRSDREPTTIITEIAARIMMDASVLRLKLTGATILETHVRTIYFLSYGYEITYIH